MAEHGEKLLGELVALGREAQSEKRAYDAAIDYARKLGAEHGRNMAEWYVQETMGSHTHVVRLEPDVFGCRADRTTGARGGRSPD